MKGPGIHFKDARRWWKSFRETYGYVRAMPKRPFRRRALVILIAYCLGAGVLIVAAVLLVYALLFI